MRVAHRTVRNVATRGAGFNLGKIAGKISVNEQENLNPVKSAKLLITNLDNNVSDSDICELFSEFGSIREVAVHYNCWGYSLGTAHVVFVQHEHAAEAARRYNGVPFDGRPMTITIEGSPNGSYVSAAPLPVKMRLSFGPNHVFENTLRNPLSQVNRPRGRPSKLSKTPKRLASGPKPFSMSNNGGFSGLGAARGRGRPRGVPAVRGRGRPIGRLPTAAELDLELDEYHQKKGSNGAASINGDDQEMSDDFGVVKDVLEEPPEGELMEIVAQTKTPKNTPGRGGKQRKTPSRTPATKTPSRTPATKTPSRTPATKTPSRTPATKTPSRTPATKTPSRTPATKTPSRTPATKTPSRTPATKTPSRTPSTKTPSRTPATKTPSRTPATKTPSTTPATKTPSTTSAPKTPSTTPAPKTPSTTSAPKTPSTTSAPKTPSTTSAPKTPSTTPAPKTPSTTPAKKTPSTTPATKTPTTTPAPKTPSRTPAPKTPSTTPAKKTPSTTPAKKTPSRTSATKTPSGKFGKTLAKASKKTPAKTPGKTSVRAAKQTEAPATSNNPAETPSLINDLEEKQQHPASAVRGAVKKSNPRRSGRFSRMGD